MNKRLYKFISIGTVSVTALAGTAFVVSCGTKSTSKTSSSNSTSFDSRDARKYDQWVKDFPEFKDLIVDNKLVDDAFVGKLKDDKLPEGFYLPDSVNEIGVGAFRGITINKGFEFPFATLVINKYAFQGAKLPDGFTVPRELRTVSSYAFADIEIPNNFSFDMYSKGFVVANTAFANSKFKDGAQVSLTTFFGIKTKGATDIVASDGSTIINEHEANEIKVPKNINDWSFPVKLTTVPKGVFKDAWVPEDFKFPYWVTTIESTAFYNAHLPKDFKVSLASTTQNLATIEGDAFSFAVLKDGFEITRKDGADPVIKSGAFFFTKTNGIQVNKYTYDALITGGINLVGTELKPSQTKVDELKLENGHIKAYAYAGIDFTAGISGTSEVLAAIKSGQVTAIDTAAFQGAKFPADFDIPASVTSLAYRAFADADFAKDSITVPKSVTTMEESVFEGAKGKAIVFDANVDMLPASTFAIADQNSAKYIAEAKAASSSAETKEQRGFLDGITFGPNTTIKSIAKAAFKNQIFKAGFALPTSLNVLRDGAFLSTTFEDKLTVSISDLVLQNEVFANSEFKNGVDVSGSTIKTMGHSIFSKVKVAAAANIVLPAELSYIPSLMFYQVELPTAFKLPNKVKTIGDSAFSGAKLNASFTLSDLDQLTEIGKGAFGGRGHFTDATTGMDQVERSVIPAGFALPAGDKLKVIRSGAFQYTDWSANTSEGLGGLTSDFKYSTTTVDGLLESDVFQGSKFNAKFKLPATQDIITSGMFREAEITEADTALVNDFKRMTIFAAGSFETSKISFKLQEMTALKTIMSAAFRNATIKVENDWFQIPNSIQTIEEKAFFGTNTLTAELDWNNNPIKRTVNWYFKDPNGVYTKAEEDNGNPMKGSIAKASSNEYTPDFSSTQGKSGASKI